MKITATLILSCLFGGNVLAATGGLRKEFVDDLPAKLETVSRGGEFSYEELGLQDDREAGALCDSLLGGLLAQLPSYMKCSCKLYPFRRYVIFSCGTKFCLPNDVGGTGTIDLSSVCVNPSYNGKLTLSGQLTSTVCNEAISFNFLNATGRNETLTIPKTCGSAQHVQRDFSHIETCTFTIGKESCPCTVCASKQDVTLNCTGIKQLGSLAQYATFTCIGLSLLGGANTAQVADFEQNQPLEHFIQLAVEQAQGDAAGNPTRK